MIIHSVLCEIVKNGRVLLQKKSDELFGGGRWNGVGGKLKEGESPENCVIREVFEETGLKLSNPIKIGVLYFYYGNRFQVDWVAHIFSADSFSGIINPSPEGALHWFKIEEIPYEEMWPDDKHWLPLLLSGKKFEGRFYFDESKKKLLDFTLKEKL